MTPPKLLHSTLEPSEAPSEQEGVVPRRAQTERDDDRDLGGGRDGGGGRYCAKATHICGAQRASEGWNRAGARWHAAVSSDLPAHLEIVPEETIAARRVDLLEHRSEALSLLTVRYRRKRLGTYLRGRAPFPCGTHTHTVKDSWAMAMACDALGKPCTTGGAGMGVRGAGVGARPPTRSQRLGSPTAVVVAICAGARCQRLFTCTVRGPRLVALGLACTRPYSIPITVNT